MRHLRPPCLRVVLLYAVTAATSTAQPEVRRAAEAELAAIQETIRQLVRGVNERNVAAIKAVTIPSFDARSEGRWFNRDGSHPFSLNTSDDLKGVEVAALIRGGRLLTGDVALADGFFRTLGWPGGADLAGSVTLTLVKRDNKWLAAAARLGAYRFSGSSVIEVKPAATHAPAGPDGWITLFDGSSMDPFIGPGGDPVSASWKIEDGVLKLDPVNGEPSRGLRTKDTYRSFELRFEWKVPSKGNSGVKYRLFYLMRGDAAGHEYQLADDAGDPGAMRNPAERSGALYNQVAPSKKSVKPAGEWNSSVLMVRGRHCEHWLNGEKVVDYETESGPLEGPLLIQNHGTQAWFRNVKIRRLD